MSNKASRIYTYGLFVLNEQTRMWEWQVIAEYDYVVNMFNEFTNRGRKCIILPKPYHDWFPPRLHTRDFVRMCLPPEPNTDSLMEALDDVTTGRTIPAREFDL